MNTIDATEHYETSAHGTSTTSIIIPSHSADLQSQDIISPN